MVRIAITLATLAALTGNAASEAPAKFELEGNNLKVPYAVVFDTAKPTLTAGSAPALEFVKAYLDAKTYISMMRVEVHSDAAGDEKASQKLSEQRAYAVTKALVAAGIDCKRLIPVGFGSTKPVADNKTAEGRMANRRTVFANAALRGRPIGGNPLDGGGVIAGDPCK